MKSWARKNVFLTLMFLMLVLIVPNLLFVSVSLSSSVDGSLVYDEYTNSIEIKIQHAIFADNLY